MTIQSLQQLGVTILSPVLTFFESQLLANKQKNEPLFFLAREGYWLEKAYQAYCEAKGEKADSRYLLVSRAFLFKIGLLEPKTFAYSLNFKFSGSLYELMRTRFMLSDVSIRKAFSDKQQQQNILLPADLDKVSKLLEANIGVLAPIIRESHSAYKAYLETLGFFEQNTVNIVDIGYSGTIQTLLGLIFDKNIAGHYLIASNPGVSEVAGNTLTMTGYLKENVTMGGGYVPLDRSMFLEALLTAPDGQFQDIRFSALPHRQFDFYYGRKVESQHRFHLIEQIVEGAISQMKDYASHNIEFTSEEVEALYSAFVTKKGMFPREIWPLFCLDDDTANEGTINGLDFFGLK